MTLPEALAQSHASERGWRSAWAHRGAETYFADVRGDAEPIYTRGCAAADTGTGYISATPEEVAGLDWKPLRRVPPEKAGAGS
jgi:hypothetical protein